MSEELRCPNCKKPAGELIPLDSTMKQALADEVSMNVEANTVCPDCFAHFKRSLSNHEYKETKRVAKEQNRLSLWRRRVDLIREAREKFALKNFGGAVVAYEKYLRVLELIYDVKPNEIQVSFFNNPAREKELAVIASAYWDLIRIYDQAQRFPERLNQCVDKLADFLPFTPIYADILRRIEAHKKMAKNKEAFNRLLKRVKTKKKRCFIATAAFQNEQAPVVQVLCAYRDEVLTKHLMGRLFISTYYTVSPPVANLLDHSPFLRRMAKSSLKSLAHHLNEKYLLKSNPY